MKSVYFSPLTLGFYPEEWKQDGSYPEGVFPTDAVILTDEEADTYWKQSHPSGKQLGAIDGRPAWIDNPKPTQEQSVERAENLRSVLRAGADEQIAWLQDAVDLLEATEDEALMLTAWKKYRVLLMRVDTSAAPDVTWPDLPK
ncbi:TPA: tail fiber assembly protein [Enterobacter roggenkampii]|nr:tail fiber assembly protein [Enterobacter roggenkampii]